MNKRKWQVELEKHLKEKYGEQFAERVIKHLWWINTYEEYGAPGHMDFVLIKALTAVLDDLTSDD